MEGMTIEDFFKDPESILIVLAVIALPFAFYYDSQQKKKRQAVYRSHGFSAVDKSRFNSWAGIERFANLDKMGITRFAKEHMIGIYKDYEIGVFLHSVADGSNSGKHQTATLIKGKSALPQFTLRPEWFRDRVKGVLGNEDIDFAHHGDFSKKYFLDGEHEATVRSLFNDTVLSYFSSKDQMWVESRGSDLLIFREYDRLRDGSKLTQYLDRAIEIYEMFHFAQGC